MKQYLLCFTMLLLIGCGQKTSTPQPSFGSEPKKFTSLMSKTGDITLTLNPDHTFDIALAAFDQQDGQPIKDDDLKGKWTIDGDALTLNAYDNNQITYAYTSTVMEVGNDKFNLPTYAFKSNNKGFFGTGIDLMDAQPTDSILIKHSN